MLPQIGSGWPRPPRALRPSLPCSHGAAQRGVCAVAPDVTDVTAAPVLKGAGARSVMVPLVSLLWKSRRGKCPVGLLVPPGELGAARDRLLAVETIPGTLTSWALLKLSCTPPDKGTARPVPRHRAWLCSVLRLLGSAPSYFAYL